MGQTMRSQSGSDTWHVHGASSRAGVEVGDKGEIDFC